MNQEIFEGLSHDWWCASWNSSGLASVHKKKPRVSSTGSIQLSRGEQTGDSERRNDWDLPVPPEGIEAVIIERVVAVGEVSPVPTNGLGIPLHLQAPTPPVPTVTIPMQTQLLTQDVFVQDLGKLCKYAALNAAGNVWLFEHMPTLFGPDFSAPGYTQKVEGKFKASEMPVVIQKIYGSVPFTTHEPLNMPGPVRKCTVFDCFANAQPDDLCCKGHATTHSAIKPCTFAEQGCIRINCDGDHVFKTEAERDAFYGTKTVRHKDGCTEKCAASACPCQDVDAVYRDFNVKQVDAMNRAVSTTNQELIDTLNGIKLRVNSMYSSDELTVTQVLAILGELPK